MSQKVVKEITGDHIHTGRHGAVTHRVRTVGWPYTIYENDDGSRVASAMAARTRCGRFLQGFVIDDPGPPSDRCSRCYPEVQR